MMAPGEFPYNDPEDLKPVPREPKLPRCKYCPGNREITGDGYGGYVHADNYQYQCEPGFMNSTTAAPKFAEGGTV